MLVNEVIWCEMLQNGSERNHAVSSFLQQTFRGLYVILLIGQGGETPCNTDVGTVKKERQRHREGTVWYSARKKLQANDCRDGSSPFRKACTSRIQSKNSELFLILSIFASLVVASYGLSGRQTQTMSS